jgi:RNA recognition motif-containing protein
LINSEWWEQYEVPDEWWEQYEVPDENDEFEFIVGQTIYIGNLSLEVTKEDLKEVLPLYARLYSKPVEFNYLNDSRSNKLYQLYPGTRTLR